MRRLFLNVVLETFGYFVPYTKTQMINLYCCRVHQRQGKEAREQGHVPAFFIHIIYSSQGLNRRIYRLLEDLIHSGRTFLLIETGAEVKNPQVCQGRKCVWQNDMELL